MAFYRPMERPPTGISYLRFLFLCGAGFAAGGVLLVILGSLVLDVGQPTSESRNVEAIVAWTAGCMCFAVSLFFGFLALTQWKKIVRMRSVATNLVEGQENTLYQAVHAKPNYHRPDFLEEVDSMGQRQKGNL